jgi:hypothetical protein
MRTTLALLVLVSIALADGKAFVGDRSSLFVARDTSQTAFISCRDGVERLIVSLDLPMGATDKAVWVVPVNAPADRATLELVDELPRFIGYDPREKLRDSVRALATGLRVTQIWPLLADTCLLPSLGRSGLMTSGRVDRFGLRSELVTATSVETLRTYVAENGLTLTDEQLASFGPYLDEQHCLAITFVTDATEIAKHQRGLAVSLSFPSGRPWYPMRATSGYGEEAIAVQLYVDGLWSLATPGGVRDANLSHFRAVADDAERAWLGRGGAFEYTRLRLSEPATRFTSDFEFDPTTPRRWAMASAWEQRVPHWAKTLLGVTVASLMLTACGAAAALIMKQSLKAGAAAGALGSFTLLATHFWLRDSAWPPAIALNRARVRGGGFRAIYSLLVMLLSAIVTMSAELL